MTSSVDQPHTSTSAINHQGSSVHPLIMSYDFYYSKMGRISFLLQHKGSSHFNNMQHLCTAIKLVANVSIQ